MKIFTGSLLLFFVVTVSAQPDRWQQRIKYIMDIKVDAAANQFTGTQKIDYWNNSPDTLTRVFFHLYWNAFQPNSMMDVRSRELGKILVGVNKKGEDVYDWDSRVKDRIKNLKPDEIGYQKVKYVKVNGVEQPLIEHETILEVKLLKPIAPKSKSSFDVAFEAQVPKQVRRSGRDNAEGIRFSMSQWYPKMAEYDYQGWNANPYVAREFYGVWGDFDVNITIDKKYMLAGSGTLQNAAEVGYGYQPDGVQVHHTAGANLTWKFKADNVHDFVWAADTAYTMIKRQPANGPLIYVVYKKADSTETSWKKMADFVEKAYPYMAKTFGAYPYKNYSFIQGGDGGMEYPMATLIKSYSIGTAVHEWMHSWYQGLMGTNESLYPWMDEGFTSYAESRVVGYINQDSGFWYQKDYEGYFALAKSPREEPMSTHSDHYNTNYAYSKAAYNKGAVFLAQLGYIVGDKKLDEILLDYYNQWRFKHPNPNDFIRVAEKASGMELDWYKEYWVNTTRTIDFALGDVNFEEGKSKIVIKRSGGMPMPLDVLITYKDGKKELHYIPLNLMYGSKAQEDSSAAFIQHPEWKWTDTEYSFEIPYGVTNIKEINIDPSMRLADINRVNNRIVVPGN
ncbi:M1 family metallopeptidase [Foetidibacter luteolus]|uniref:M1 family metallopeptidase n=1 Tax=Foetidibacter luteolus TaxID=2608880 RepID=UPI00129A624F|nr:M1 family metallopeptidase [Foetidibacter luteolus]